MRLIVRYILFILAVFLVIQCKKEEPKPEFEITDINFLNALIQLGIDTDGNGIVSPSEAEAVNFLDVSSCDISDISGIEAFINLDTLLCYNNQFTTLDVSNNTDLILLKCENNWLTYLDVSNSTVLRYLLCYYNNLTSLDVSNNTALEKLFCFNNQLTALDVSDDTVLKYLDCSDNQLTSLDVSNNTSLFSLSCGNNQFTTLDVSYNISLGLTEEGYYCFSCCLDIRNMRSLEKVCVWTMPFPPAGFPLCAEGSPNVYFTTDCGL